MGFYHFVMRLWPMILLLHLALLSTANAGPWPRDEGATFLSFGSVWTTPADDITARESAITTVFAEHGLGPDLTIGFDAHTDASEQATAFVFIKRPILAPDRPDRFAWRAGAGVTSSDGDQTAFVVGGLYWGRGLDTRFGPGWATVDLQTHQLLEGGGAIYKADATIGVSPTDRWKLILQAQSGAYPNADPFLRLAPSVVRRVGDTQHIEIGGQVGITGDDQVGLKLNTWLEF